MENYTIELKDLVIHSFGIACNANDFFATATADMVIIYPEDLEWVLPIYSKYGNDGLNAVMSHIRKALPLKPYITDSFKQACAEIEKLNPKVYSED